MTAQPPWPPNAFDEFWRAYPRRLAKKAALKAFDRVNRSSEIAFPPLLAAVERYADSVAGKDVQFVAHPATWLNQGRWEDDPASLGNRYVQRKISAAEGWAQRRRSELEGPKCPHGLKLIASNSRPGD